MDAVQEVDSLIGMVRTLLCNSGQPRFITPEYREFHDRLTDFIYRNHLDETEDWAVIQMNLIYRSNQVMVPREADTILVRLENIKRMLLKNAHEPFWLYIHPQIYGVAKERFASGLYADSIESAFKEINSRVKRIVKKQRDVECDGADLMRKCFSENNPVLTIAGIRNPKAHENQTITKDEAIRKLNFASLLMYKVDLAVRNTRISE